MVEELNRIGLEFAEQEAKDLSEYYFENDYYTKASSFSTKNIEFFFIGRTGSGKSAILEMIRQKKRDASRVINITAEDFTFELLTKSEEISSVPDQYRELTFKILWKHVIIVNILKTIHGNDYKWKNLIYGNNKEAYKLLKELDELKAEQKTFSDQVISFLQRIKKISFGSFGGVETSSGDSRDSLYALFKILRDFEKEHLKEHLKNRYIYLLIDDLDKNWNSHQDNVDVIKCLFSCIIELGREFHGNIKFVVALRTDIFKQLNFHQTEKIRPYITEINWYNHQLRRIIELRLTSYWEIPLEEALSRFPRKVKGEDIFDFFIQRTMRRPRDIISFINLCINETNHRSARNISPGYILAAEKQYSRLRAEALIDEWKFVYPNLETWIELFAGRKFVIDYSELRNILECTGISTKEIIDILYEVGFLGYRSSEYERVNFSFVSKGKPGFDHKYHIHIAFFSYLDELAEELGRTRYYPKPQESLESQRHEDMIELLERVLNNFSDGISISVLQAKILEDDPAFKELMVNYDSFEDFLKSIPEKVILYYINGIVFAKQKGDGDNPDELAKTKQEKFLTPLKQVLNQFPEFGVRISYLEKAILEIDSTLNKLQLGYDEFTIFLQNMPAIVTLYEFHEIEYVKLKEIDDEPKKLVAARQKKIQEKALVLLKQVLNQFPDGIDLGYLKHAMLEIDSTFDERKLGYIKFSGFLQSLPEIVTLYKTKGAYYAKPKKLEHNTGD